MMKALTTRVATGILMLSAAGSALAKGSEDNPAQVEVLNFPDVQSVAVTGTPSVSVASLPTVQVDDSTPIDVNVTNAAPTYSFVGYTDPVERVVSDTELFIIGQFYCREQFGSGARIATGSEMRRLFETLTELTDEALAALLPPIQGEIPIFFNTLPYGNAWFTKDESLDSEIFLIDNLGQFAKNAQPPEQLGYEATVACSAPGA